MHCPAVFSGQACPGEQPANIKDDKKIRVFSETLPRQILRLVMQGRKNSQRLWLSETLMETPEMGKLETSDFLHQQKQSFSALRSKFIEVVKCPINQ